MNKHIFILDKIIMNKIRLQIPIFVYNSFTYTMKLTELKNEKGLLSGIIVPVADFRELKTIVKPGTPFYTYLNRALSAQPEPNGDKDIMSNGHTIDETNKTAALITEELYMYAFEKGVPMFYRDNRVKSPKEFIRANPDGSEDLVTYNLEKRDYTLVKNLLPPGKGYWSYLTTA